MNLEAVYPNDNAPNEEMSFEELRAKSRGWLNRDWAVESKQRIAGISQTKSAEEPDPATFPENEEGIVVGQETQHKPDIYSSPSTQNETTVSVNLGREGKAGRPKKTKIMEVKGETQTSMCQASRKGID